MIVISLQGRNSFCLHEKLIFLDIVLIVEVFQSPDSSLVGLFARQPADVGYVTCRNHMTNRVRVTIRLSWSTPSMVAELLHFLSAAYSLRRHSVI